MLTNVSPLKAPSAPGFIHFGELTTTSVNVSWGEPKRANGIVEGYRLVYEPRTPVDGEEPARSARHTAVFLSDREFTTCADVSRAAGPLSSFSERDCWNQLVQ